MQVGETVCQLRNAKVRHVLVVVVVQHSAKIEISTYPALHAVQAAGHAHEGVALGATVNDMLLDGIGGLVQSSLWRGENADELARKRWCHGGDRDCRYRPSANQVVDAKRLRL